MSEDIFHIKNDRIASYICFTFANSCMPTLMKAKPSTLISFHKRYIDDKLRFFRTLKEEAWQFDCYYKLLCESETAYYILIYNMDLLQDIFLRYGENTVLTDAGYLADEESFYRNLYHFKKRYSAYKIHNLASFPHEVGILLGYPIEDVEAYIENSGENYLLCGYWKVYHNVEEAGKIFNNFSNLRKEAVSLIFSGRELKEIMSYA